MGFVIRVFPRVILRSEGFLVPHMPHQFRESLHQCSAHPHTMEVSLLLCILFVTLKTWTTTIWPAFQLHHLLCTAMFCFEEYYSQALLCLWAMIWHVHAYPGTIAPTGHLTVSKYTGTVPKTTLSGVNTEPCLSTTSFAVPKSRGWGWGRVRLLEISQVDVETVPTPGGRDIQGENAIISPGERISRLLYLHSIDKLHFVVMYLCNNRNVRAILSNLFSNDQRNQCIKKTAVNGTTVLVGLFDFA